MVSDREMRRRVTTTRHVEYVGEKAKTEAAIWLHLKWLKDYFAYRDGGGKLLFEFSSYSRKCRSNSGQVLVGRGIVVVKIFEAS